METVTPIIDVQPITWEAWQRLNDLQARIEAFGTLDASTDDPDDVNAVLEMQKDALGSTDIQPRQKSVALRDCFELKEEFSHGSTT